MSEHVEAAVKLLTKAKAGEYSYRAVQVAAAQVHALLAMHEALLQIGATREDVAVVSVERANEAIRQATDSTDLPQRSGPDEPAVSTGADLPWSFTIQTIEGIHQMIISEMTRCHLFWEPRRACYVVMSSDATEHVVLSSAEMSVMSPFVQRRVMRSRITNLLEAGKLR